MTKYYDYQKLLSYNAFISIIIGERGVGKSYGAKKVVIEDFLKNGNQFIYIRRYNTELETSVPQFFADIMNNNEYPDYVFSVKKSKKMSVFYLQKKYVDEKGEEKLDEKQEIGYAIPLSTSHVLKSTSFPTVRTIIFDEFLLTKGSYHYIRNELTLFLDMIETVGRLRDNLRVFMIANASDAYNPYMSYFDLDLPYNSEFKTFKDGEIVVNYIKNEEYRNEKRKSRFGKLIRGTDYEKYAIDNQWLGRTNKDFVKKKSGLSVCRYVFYYDKIKYGLWYDRGEHKVYVSHDHDPMSSNIYAFDIISHNMDTMFIKLRTNLCYIALKTAFEYGYLYYESVEIKERIMSLLEKMEG